MHSNTNLGRVNATAELQRRQPMYDGRHTSDIDSCCGEETAAARKRRMRQQLQQQQQRETAGRFRCPVGRSLDAETLAVLNRPVAF